MKSKHRKCKICRVKLPVEQGIINGLDFVCGTDHLAELGMKRVEKNREQKKRQERKELRERKQKLKTLQDYIDDGQKLVNRLVVMEDKPKGCISCPDGEVTDSGHYFHRGSKYRTSWLTLSRLNLNGQCRSCNSYKGGGNQHEYRLGYIERYGEAQFKELEELKRRTDCGEIPKPTIEEVKEFIVETKKALKSSSCVHL